MVAYPGKNNFLFSLAADLRLCYFPSVLHSLNDKLLSHTILGVCIHSYVANPSSRID
jgi:hormone-sensitive lipase